MSLVLAIGARPPVVAARMRGADLLKRLIGGEIAEPRIDLDVLARVVFEGLAGLLVDAAGPVDGRVRLGADDRSQGRAPRGFREVTQGPNWAEAPQVPSLEEPFLGLPWPWGRLWGFLVIPRKCP